VPTADRRCVLPISLMCFVQLIPPRCASARAEIIPTPNIKAGFHINSRRPGPPVPKERVAIRFTQCAAWRPIRRAPPLRECGRGDPQSRRHSTAISASSRGIWRTDTPLVMLDSMLSTAPKPQPEHRQKINGDDDDNFYGENLVKVLFKSACRFGVEAAARSRTFSRSRSKTSPGAHQAGDGVGPTAQSGMLNATKAQRKPVDEQWYGHGCQHDKNEKHGGRHRPIVDCAGREP
jgi:hypothetical protein